MLLKTLGKYELLEQLGRGGFGTVYRAHDTILNVERALKVLHPALAADPDFIARFRQEAQVAARLEHPNIVPVYDFGEQDGRFFLAMRLIPGGSLKERLAKEGKLPFGESLKILQQVASALDYAYQQPEKLIHRDVKPGNILFEADGTARLSDFGYAKALEHGGQGSASASGGLVGTPAYMAPEIWNGEPASPASDVYSLACLFYEMLTGQSLFGGESSTPVIMKRHFDPLVLPDAWPDRTPAGIKAILLKALAKDPHERYASAGEFAKAIEQIINAVMPPGLSEQPHTLKTTRAEKDQLAENPSQIAIKKLAFPLRAGLIIGLGITSLIILMLLWPDISISLRTPTPTTNDIAQPVATAIIDLYTSITPTKQSTALLIQSASPSCTLENTVTIPLATVVFLTPTGRSIPDIYIMQVGEFPICIARRFNLNAGELFTLNKLTADSFISVGQVLQIPQTGNPFDGLRELHAHPTTYKIAPGETIYTIACYFGDVLPEDIATANGLLPPYNLEAGVVLQIP